MRESLEKPRKGFLGAGRSITEGGQVEQECIRFGTVTTVTCVTQTPIQHRHDRPILLDLQGKY